MTKRPNAGGHGAQEDQNNVSAQILSFPTPTPQQEHQRLMLCVRAWRSEADWKLVYANREKMKKNPLFEEVVR